MSIRKAVNAKCKECLYDPGSGGGTWREQIENCTSTGCPLYPYRPTPRKAKEGPKRPQPPQLRKVHEVTE